MVTFFGLVYPGKREPQGCSRKPRCTFVHRLVQVVSTEAPMVTLDNTLWGTLIAVTGSPGFLLRG